jgi:hypothetical protein
LFAGSLSQEARIRALEAHLYPNVVFAAVILKQYEVALLPLSVKLHPRHAVADVIRIDHRDPIK